MQLNVQILQYGYCAWNPCDDSINCNDYDYADKAQKKDGVKEGDVGN